MTQAPNQDQEKTQEKQETQTEGLEGLVIKGDEDLIKEFLKFRKELIDKGWVIEENNVINAYIERVENNIYRFKYYCDNEILTDFLVNLLMKKKINVTVVDDGVEGEVPADKIQVLVRALVLMADQEYRLIDPIGFVTSVSPRYGRKIEELIIKIKENEHLNKIINRIIRSSEAFNEAVDMIKAAVDKAFSNALSGDLDTLMNIAINVLDELDMELHTEQRSIEIATQYLERLNLPKELAKMLSLRGLMKLLRTGPPEVREAILHSIHSMIRDGVIRPPSKEAVWVFIERQLGVTPEDVLNTVLSGILSEAFSEAFTEIVTTGYVSDIYSDTYIGIRNRVMDIDTITNPIWYVVNKLVDKIISIFIKDMNEIEGAFERGEAIIFEVLAPNVELVYVTKTNKELEGISYDSFIQKTEKTDVNREDIIRKVVILFYDYLFGNDSFLNFIKTQGANMT